MTADELRRLVKDTFQARPHPGDTRLVCDDSGYDPNTYNLESHRIKRFFDRKDWHTITREQLIEMPQAIYFFSPEAYVYYLPALILGTLAFDEATNTLRDSFVTSLTPGVQPQRNFRERVQMLTLPEKRVIGKYLEFVTVQVYGNQPLGEAQIALDRYWYQFL